MSDIFAEARKFIAEGKLGEAIVIFEHIVKRIPENLEARHDLARLLIEFNNFEDAEAHINAGLQFNSNHQPLLSLKGILLMKMKKHDEAISVFLQLKKNGFFSSSLVLNMAISYRELNQNNTAQNILEEYLLQNKNDVNVISLLSEIVIEKKEWKKALDLIESGLKIDKQNQFLFYLKGLVFARENKWLDAIPVFRKVLEKSPHNYLAKHELGYAYIQVNYLDGAIDLLTQCLEKDPTSVPVLIDLALAYTQVPELDKALSLAEKAEKLDPYSQEVTALIREIQYAKSQLDQ